MMMMNAVIKVFVLATAVISGSVALNDKVKSTHRLLRKKTPPNRLGFADCAKQCRTKCYGRPKGWKCADKFVKQRCREFRTHHNSAIMKECLTPTTGNGCRTGQRPCFDGTCVATASCCGSERLCPDGTCVATASCCGSERLCPDGTCVATESCCGSERLCPDGTCVATESCCGSERLCTDGACVATESCCRSERLCPDKGTCVAFGTCCPGETTCSDEIAFQNELQEANPDFPGGLFSPDVIRQIVTDYHVVSGSVTFKGDTGNGSNPVFVIPEGSTSGSMAVEGTYLPPAGHNISNNLQARLFFFDALRASSSVDPVTGFFSLILTEVPFGVNPFLVLFESESYNGEGQRRLLAEGHGPRIGVCTNMAACGPAFSLTLTWDQPTSDVDLHVYEPGGSHVYFSEPFGGKDAYLNYDDTDGYGPEHYYALASVYTGSNYQIGVDMFSYNDDTSVDVTWQLHAGSFGKPLWNVTGRFREAETPSTSELIPWIFEQEPVCEHQFCDLFDDMSPTPKPLSGNQRKLFMHFPWEILQCRAVGNPKWKVFPESRTKQSEVDKFFCEYGYWGAGPWSYDWLVRVGMCLSKDVLSPEQRKSISTFAKRALHTDNPPKAKGLILDKISSSIYVFT